MSHVHPLREQELMMTRRQLFGRSALGLGTAAMAGLLGPELRAESKPLPGLPHHAPKAKRVIYLFMSGGPIHHDLWDYKPKLAEMYGKQLPDHVRDGQRVTGMTATQKGGFPLAPSKYKFTKHDNNDQGLWVSELLPHTATVAKELCVTYSTVATGSRPALPSILGLAYVAGVLCAAGKPTTRWSM